jgi:cysteinyl-tRNA synthetase
LFETVRTTNRFLAETRDFGPLALGLLARVRNLFAETGSVLGLFGRRPAEWLEKTRAAKAHTMSISSDEIERLIAERAEARTTKNFKRGDEIRDMLLEQGVQLLDSVQGTTWDIKQS